MKFTQLIIACILVIGFSFCKKKTETIPSSPVTEAPAIEVNYTLSKRFVKSNEIIQFTNQSKNADHYLWDFGDGETSTLESPDHSYKNKGTYKISLKAYNGDKESKLDTLVRCDMMASLTFTFFYTDYTPPSYWLKFKFLYTFYETRLYNSENLLNSLNTWNSGYTDIKQSKAFLCTVLCDDEKINYKLKTYVTIGGVTSGPDPNADYFLSAPLGTFYTDSFNVFKGPTPGLIHSQRFEYITLNYVTSPIQYN